MGRPTVSRGRRASVVGPAEELLSVLDAAKVAGVDPDTVRFWQRDKGLPAFKTAGGMRIFRRDALLQFLLHRFTRALAKQRRLKGRRKNG